MTAVVGGVGRHLRECPHHADGRDDCQWCRWAVETPEVLELLAIRDDARELLVASETETVPGLVAAARLVELAGDLRLDEVRVPSARRLAEEWRDEVADLLDRLRERTTEAARPHGPIDRSCRVLGGALAVAAGFARDADVDGMSPARRLATMAPVIEARHWMGMPPLASQPEWSRRVAPLDPAGVRASQLGASGVQPGSLEGLVAEATVEGQTRRLLELGEELADHGPSLRIARPVTDAPRSSRSRATVWRVARIDWHLSLVDSGLASCWGRRVDGDDQVTAVPWAVAAGMAALAGSMVSAIHAAPPRLEWPDAATPPG